MPSGLRVTLGNLPGATNDVPVSGRFIVAAPTAKGPTAPTVVRSIGQFANMFGVRTMATAIVFDTVELFFAEGGGEAVISRVLGPDAAGDSIVLKDTTPVTPADAIRLTSKSLGGNSGIAAVVVTGGIDITVEGAVRERFTGTGLLDLLQALGDSEIVNAVYVGAGEATNATVLAAGDFPLAGGSDDTEGIVTESYVAPIKRGLLHSPAAAIATPGHYPGLAGMATIADAADGHVYFAGTARGDNATAPGWAMSDASSAIRPNRGGAYSWVRVPDGDRTKVVPVEGYLAALRARAHERVGPWQVPAGNFSAARFIVALVEDVPVPNDFELISRLNPLVNDRGRITLGDYRAAVSTEENVVLLSEADSMASIVALISDVFKQFEFETIDSSGHLFSKMIGAAEGVLGPIAEAGGLYARYDASDELVDPGYRVTIDRSNNTPDTLAQNVVNVTIGVRLSPTARLIDLKVLRVPLTGAL